MRRVGCEFQIVTTEHRSPRQPVALGAPRGDDGSATARHENSPRSPARALDRRGQASGALKPISADRLVEKSITFSRPVVFDYVATPADLSLRADRLWAALADGTLKAPPIERHALGAADEAHRRLESRRTIGALVLVA